MGYKRTNTYEPFTAGSLSRDGLVEVVSTTWSDSTGLGRRTDTLTVTCREHMGGLRDYLGDVPTARMRYMALYCADPGDTVLACRIVCTRYSEAEDAWYRTFELRLAM